MTKEVTKELLNELVNAPYGQAEVILKAKGFWDEARVPKTERTLKEFEVTLEAMQPVYATVTVFAKNEAEAKKLAMDEVSHCDWEAEHFDDVEDIEISEINEVEE